MDYDAWSGVATYSETSSDGRELTIARVQDVEPILEANKRDAASGGRKMRSQNGLVDMHLHARIPVVWREAFIKKYGRDIVHPSVQREFWAELEKPENRYLKATWRRHRVRA